METIENVRTLMQSSTPTSIGKYEILGVLGRGSMGVVYKARDPEIGRIVAIKTLRKLMTPEGQVSEGALQRFKIEARSVGNLRHKNIITLFEVGEDAETPYLVMDYVEGENLRSIISRAGKLAPAQALHYLGQLASAIDFAHSKGVIHRDIKPSNVVVDADQNCFILDFGVATIHGAGFGDVVTGTPGYMSPEQIGNDDVDYRTDLFSLAVVAYQCFCGTKPFSGDNFAAISSSVLQGIPGSLTAIDSSLPLALEQQLNRALSKDREARFQSATELVGAIAISLGLKNPLNDSFTAGSITERRRRSSGWKPFFKIQSEAVSDATVEMQMNPTAVPSWREAIEEDSTVTENRRANRSEDRIKVLHKPSAKSGRHATQRVRAGKQGGITMTMKLTAFFGALSIILGILLLWIVFRGNTTEIGPVSLQSGAAGQIALQGNTKEENIALIKAPKVDPVPAGKSIHEMTEKELLGALVGTGVEDRLILDAMKVAFERKVPDLLDALVFPLQSDSYVVRIEALKTAELLEDKRIAANVILLLDDHDPLVRIQAAKTLSSLGDFRSLGYLTSRLIREENLQVRESIKQTIEKINGFPINQ